jgi:hypothetical protein
MNITLKFGQLIIKGSTINRFLIYLFIISLAIAPAFALGEGNRNLLLIAVMSLSPIILIIYKQFYKLDNWLIILACSLVIGPYLLHPNSLRWYTILYSWMFFFTFMAYNRLLLSNFFNLNQFLKLLQFLIIAYFVTLLIQQFCVLISLPIFNLSNYNPNEPWKLNSLSAEPSHSGRILGLLFYSFIEIKELVNNKKYSLKNDFNQDKWFWLAFLWTMLSMGSSTAILFLILIYFKFFGFRNLFFNSLMTLCIFYFLNILGIKQIDRLFETMKAFFSFDISSIISVDHSASIRIVPLITIFTKLDILSINGMFGHGIDSVSSFLFRYLPGAGNNISGGGFFQIWYEYGFLTFFILLIFTLKATNCRNSIINFLFWFLLVFLYGINSQITWLCIILLYTINYFKILNNNPRPVL